MASWMAPAVDRDAGFGWPKMDGLPCPADASSHFYRQFVDFDGQAANASTVSLQQIDHAACPIYPKALAEERPASSTISSADEYDFLSATSLDTQELPIPAGSEGPNHYSMPDSEIRRLQGVSLHSPTNVAAPLPTPAHNASRRHQNRIVEAISSTIRKATTFRKGKRQQKPQVDRSASPTVEHPCMAVKERSNAVQSVQSDAGFIHGCCDDPFAELIPPSGMRHYSRNGVSPSRRIKSEQELHQAAQAQGSWPPVVTEPWAGAATGYVSSADAAWWEDVNVFSAGRNAHLQHHQSYEYIPPSSMDACAAEIMLHMAPPLPQTYLPPPPPAPERNSTRPPRARSSGARHRNVSPSPMRKTRGSVSPGPQQRHSSTGSVSSARGGPGTPGTPCGVRKRRSRDAGLGGDEMGFVNFTPNDGEMLMTGVAPSGSSKTKARREREALERRRKLSEAAMKAVVAAGGDVDKLISEGFVF